MKNVSGRRRRYLLLKIGYVSEDLFLGSIVDSTRFVISVSILTPVRGRVGGVTPDHGSSRHQTPGGARVPSWDPNPSTQNLGLGSDLDRFRESPSSRNTVE